MCVCLYVYMCVRARALEPLMRIVGAGRGSGKQACSRSGVWCLHDRCVCMCEQGAGRASVHKELLRLFIADPEPTQDPVIVHTAFALAKSTHDNIDSQVCACACACACVYVCMCVCVCVCVYIYI